MGQRLDVYGKLKPIGEGVAKASPKRATQSYASDPKPGDLAMGRLKAW